jgi:hypothetical protein
VLSTALEAHQRARECREVILRDGPTVTGRDGQLRVHPVLAVEHDARAAWVSKLLGLTYDKAEAQAERRPIIRRLGKIGRSHVSAGTDTANGSWIL